MHIHIYTYIHIIYIYLLWIRFMVWYFLEGMEEDFTGHCSPAIQSWDVHHQNCFFLDTMRRLDIAISLEINRKYFESNWDTHTIIKRRGWYYLYFIYARVCTHKYIWYIVYIVSYIDSPHDIPYPKMWLVEISTPSVNLTLLWKMVHL